MVVTNVFWMDARKVYQWCYHYSHTQKKDIKYELRDTKCPFILALSIFTKMSTTLILFVSVQAGTTPPQGRVSERTLDVA